MQNKKKMLLIVCIIILVLISALLIIINLQNNNTKKQIEAILKEEQETGEKSRSIFDLIEKLYSTGIITESQKEEMIINGGELKIDDETIRLDTSSFISFTGNEVEHEDLKYNLKFKFIVNKLTEAEGLKITELGFIIFSPNKFDNYYPEIDIEEKFKLGANEKYEMPIVEMLASNYVSDDVSYMPICRFINIPEEDAGEVRSVRAYVKYTYNGIDGTAYSNIVSASVDSASK